MTNEDTKEIIIPKEILKENIVYYVKRGYRLVTEDESSAQLMKPKSYNVLLVILFFLLGILPGIVYLLIVKDQHVFLTVDQLGTINTIKRGGAPAFGIIVLLTILVLEMIVACKFFDIISDSLMLTQTIGNTDLLSFL